MSSFPGGLPGNLVEHGFPTENTPPYPHLSAAGSDIKAPERIRFYHNARSQRAKISFHSTKYKSQHFLSLPQELRWKIYHMVVDDPANRTEQPWHRSPGDRLAALSATCRQTYHDTDKIRFRNVVQWNRLQAFLSVKFNRTTIRQFRSLSLQIPLDAHVGYFTGLDMFLRRATPYLTELRLYFTGSDNRYRPIYTHGCGRLCSDCEGPPLSIHGQRDMEMLPLWQRIAVLTELEVLVISNANLQVFEPMFLYHKRRLQRLYISTDPRSKVHQRFDINSLGFLLTAIMPTDGCAPIKVLQIPANAALAAVTIAAKVASTLEHLTWIVPDPLLKFTLFPVLWNRHTANLLTALALKGIRLHTLRICLQGSGVEDNDPSYGELTGAIKHHLPSLPTLRHLELHFKTQSPWLGQEIIARMPNGLEHLYLTDRAIHPLGLLRSVRGRYLTESTFVYRLHESYDDIYDTPSAYPCIQSLSNDDTDFESKPYRDVIRQERGPWYIDPETFAHREMTQIEARKAIRRHRSRSEDNLSALGLVGYNYIDPYLGERSDIPFNGECRLRDDFVPFDSGDLKFMHFEYSDTRNCDPSLFDYTATGILFFINGRLLDKARNEHMAPYQGPVRSARLREHSGRLQTELPPLRTWKSKSHGPSEYGTETATRSAHPEYSMLLDQLYENEQDIEERTEASLAELLECRQIHYQDWYFGDEDGATKAFEREMVAKAEHLPAYKHVVILEDVDDGTCRWMCPEAPVE